MPIAARLPLIFVLTFLLVFTSCGGGAAARGTNTPAVPPGPAAPTTAYENPLKILTAEGTVIESCPDPAVIRSRRAGDPYWYMFCTARIVIDRKRSATNQPERFIAIARSTDLVNWSYVGDVFRQLPPWRAASGGLWAPNIEFLNGRYYLYYSVSETTLPGGGSAIYVATADSPAGPWTAHPTPVIEPNSAPCCPGTRRWTIDSDIISYQNQLYMIYGSYAGGISMRRLSADGFSSDTASQMEIAPPDRYEGAELIERNGFWYLLVSATNCCNGALTGYSVFAARAKSPLGPFVDGDGVPLNQARVGGTPVLSMNGNRWVGPGHHTVVTDLSGQDWMIYHAVDVNRPFQPGSTELIRWPLLDPIVWIDGWPQVRGGLWASDTRMPAPVSQPNTPSSYTPERAVDDQPGVQLAEVGDEFNDASLTRWTWVRPRPAGEFSVTGGLLRMNTQAADVHMDSNNASVLTTRLPEGDLMVEVKVRTNVPATGCCFNFAQGGLLIYKNDDAYIKAAAVSIGHTRQNEFAKEIPSAPSGHPRYGNTVLGPAGEWSHFRVVRRTRAGVERYAGYSSLDGKRWTRGGTWTHSLPGARLGLVAMAAGGFTAEFDYVRVYRLR